MTARSRLRAALGLTGAAAVAATARADAPADQYNLFNMTVETIQDARTSLVWQRFRYSSPPQLSFQAAAAYCATFSIPTYPTGWRVPSYKELLTLIDESPHIEWSTGAPVLTAIDGSAFPGTVADADYWTSSLYARAPLTPTAYAVNFGDGSAKLDALGNALYVRCVR